MQNQRWVKPSRTIPHLGLALPCPAWPRSNVVTVCANIGVLVLGYCLWLMAHGSWFMVHGSDFQVIKAITQRRIGRKSESFCSITPL